jgi:hypothetical protein
MVALATSAWASTESSPEIAGKESTRKAVKNEADSERLILVEKDEK